MERPAYVQAFINSYLPCARTVELFFRIPVSVTLAFAAVELDWGRSYLAKKGIIFGQLLEQEEATCINSINVRQVINRRQTNLYFKLRTAREAFLAYAEMLASNPEFADARRHPDDPERFLEILENGSQTSLERERVQKARTFLKEHKLKEFDSWLYVELNFN